MPSRIEQQMPYSREMEAYKRVKLEEREGLVRAIKDMLDKHVGGRTSLSAILELTEKTNPSGTGDGIAINMFNPYKDIDPYGFRRHGYKSKIIPFSAIPEGNREEIKQAVRNKIDNDPSALNYNRKPWEWKAAMGGEALAGVASAVTVPADLIRLSWALKNDIFGDGSRGLSTLGESYSEWTSRKLKNHFGSGMAKSSGQRYADTIANFIGGLVGGGALMKGGYKVGVKGFNAAKGLFNPGLPKTTAAEARKILQDLTLEQALKGVAKHTAKHGSLGLGLGAASQFMDENDIPWQFRLPTLLGGGYFGGRLINSIGKGTQQELVRKNSDKIRQELQKLAGIDKINYNSKGINKYANEGSQSLKDTAKNTMKEASAKYDHILDDFEMPPEMQHELRENLKYTNIKVADKTGKKVNIKEYLTPEGNFGLKEILEHTKDGAKKTGKYFNKIDPDDMMHNDIEYMSLRDLDNLHSQLKKMQYKGTNHYNLNKDIKLVDENLKTLVGNEPMTQVRSNYKEAVQKATPINKLNKSIEANSKTTNEILDNFIKNMSDPDKLKTYAPLMGSRIDQDALFKIGQTVPSSKKFLYSLDSEIGRARSDKIINPEFLKKFGVLGGDNIPKFMNMQKAFNYLDDLDIAGTQVLGIKDFKNITKNPGIMEKIGGILSPKDMTHYVDTILNTGKEPRSGMLFNFLRPLKEYRNYKIAQDQAQAYVDENYRYGDSKYNQYIRKILRGMENARDN